MSALAFLRIAARRASTVSTPTRRAGGNLRLVSNTLTRSFITSVGRAEPATTKPKATSQTSKSEKENQKETVKTKTKTKAKKAVEKPVKKATKQRRVNIASWTGAVLIYTAVRIPRDIKIPPLGMTAYIYFLTKIFEPEFPRTRENFAEIAKMGGEAWKNLSEAEKQKCVEAASAARAKANQERQDYINALDPKILRELNRRRVAIGKPKMHKKSGRSMNPYFMWIEEFRASHPGQYDEFGSVGRLGEIWSGMSDEEKQVKDSKFSGHQLADFVHV
ncbi:hypothetical protein C0993_012129 [Termitomyces sp. T159_Od127]|nr:hypothetical protein C0993_012129 [Termitomyces sp. T159_Od127]